uniref:CSON005373 protein n=1 Tax=Culicoides sonorensis TaxID=179676 RepID=A0A336LZZ0_CULSO
MELLNSRVPMTHIFIFLIGTVQFMEALKIDCSFEETTTCDVKSIHHDGINEITNKNNINYGDVTRIIMNSININQSLSNLCEIFPSLEEIIMTNSHLSTFNVESLRYCENLRTLDISGNDLPYIDVSNMTLKSVMTLNLSRNHLMDVDLTEIFTTFPNLKEIDLAKNRFHCTRIEPIINQLKSKRIKFTSSSTRIDCIDTRQWSDLITDNISTPILVKSILTILNNTEQNIHKIINREKTEIGKYKNETESDLIRIETSISQLLKQSNEQYTELQMRFSLHMERTTEEIKSLNRLLHLCYALLLAFVIAIIASLFIKNCQSKKLMEKPTPSSQKEMLIINNNITTFKSSYCYVILVQPLDNLHKHIDDDEYFKYLYK